MVFIVDDGGKFNCPINKIWELNASEGKHPHASLRNQKAEPAGDNMMILSSEVTIAGQNVKDKAKMNMMPPLGYSLEWLEGPFTDSKAFQYYTPEGNKTRVTVVGEFKSPNLSDAQLKKEVLNFLERVFEEDQTNLKNLK